MKVQYLALLLLISMGSCTSMGGTSAQGMSVDEYLASCKGKNIKVLEGYFYAQGYSLIEDHIFKDGDITPEDYLLALSIAKKYGFSRYQLWSKGESKCEVFMYPLDKEWFIDTAYEKDPNAIS